jgi:hypothetical protein
MSNSDKLAYGLTFVGTGLAYMAGGLWVALLALAIGLCFIVSVYTPNWAVIFSPLIVLSLVYASWNLKKHYEARSADRGADWDAIFESPLPPLDVSLVPMPVPLRTTMQSPPPKLVETQPSLRDQGLRLSTEISEFLVERQRYDPTAGQTVSFTGIAQGVSSQIKTPPYMQQTLGLFIQQYEVRIIDIHDDFSKHGLQDLYLDSMYTQLPQTVGNVDWAIRIVAESIRNLALLTPPENLYKDVSNDKLVEMSLDETDTVGQMTSGTMSELSTERFGPFREGIRGTFFFKFADCCLTQIEYLRAELMERLGPAGHDIDEMRGFNGSHGITAIRTDPPGEALATVLDYMPKFRSLAEKLKAKTH